MGDPLLDWLDVHGRDRGYVPDVVDDSTDFTRFVMKKGVEFEACVYEHWADMFDVVRVEGWGGSEQANEQTWEAMTVGAPFVYQASLVDHQDRIYGSVDFLVRADTLEGLFPGTFPNGRETLPSRFGRWHYVPLDVKYSTLRFGASGRLLNSDSALAYKTQVVLYARALGRLQGHEPSHGYLLGREWSQTVDGNKIRSGDCLDRIAAVSPDERYQGQRVADVADEAVGWVRNVRVNGHGWVLDPPSVPGLRPNAKTQTSKWATVAKRLAEQTNDLTRLWYVGPDRRDTANRDGLTDWTDPAVTAARLGIAGRTGATLDAMLRTDRDTDPAVTPKRVETDREIWGPVPGLEFYVDFETVSDLDDDFSRFPRKGGQPLVFMIGCGHMENSEWVFECFTADRLEPAAEKRIIGDWYEHMRVVTRRLSGGQTPRVFHWSAAETTSLETAWNSARTRHPDEPWQPLQWYDFLGRVVRREPVVVRGARGFGLKKVTKALHGLGLVDCEWETGPADGLGAMVGAWSSQHLIDNGQADRLADVPLMETIKDYNETDCRAMMEIVAYLREHH